MPRLSLLSVAFAATLTTLSAHAVVVNASFTGLVQSQTNAGFALNSAISGSFAYDTGSASFVSYNVGGQNVAPGYASLSSFSADLYSANYLAQVSPVPLGTGMNSTFGLDLEALNSTWASSSPISLLTDSKQLASNLDTPSSSFRYYMANADGTQVHSVVAQLTGLNVVAAVPEPSTCALLALGLGAVLVRGARRRR